jgi:inner membrane protein YidH
MTEPAQKAVNRLKEAAAEIEESADRRTILAADRTIFAAERTYAAWVRTGLASLAAGVGAKAALGQVMAEAVVLATGSVLVLFSAFCFGAAVWRELFPGPPPPRPDVRQLPPVLLIALNGFLVLVALIAFVGIWTARTPGA